MRISDWSSDVCSSDLALLLGFMAAGLYIQPVIDPDALPAVLTGLAGVAAMAVQNGTGRLVLGNHAPTTIMTGNTTQAVIDAVDILRLPAGAEARKARSDRFPRMGPALVAFAIGAILGAFGYLAGSFRSEGQPFELKYI